MGVRVSLVYLRACTIRQKGHEHFLQEERESWKFEQVK